MKIINETIGVGYVRRMGIKLRSGRAIYLHRWHGSDAARDPHDHPKAFLSIGLWGSYIEENYKIRDWRLAPANVREWRAPWFRRFPAEHIHRIILPNKCWTLVITGPVERTWGFWVNLRSGLARFTPHYDYV